jgi:hypothetical protein
MIPMCWKCASRITGDVETCGQVAAVTLTGCKECSKVHDFASAKIHCPLLKSNPSSIIGKTIEEARAKLPDQIIRVVMQDGERLCITQDESPGRINISVINDKIDEIVGIG